MGRHKNQRRAPPSSPPSRSAGSDYATGGGNVDTVDVLVVGAGVSGLFCAARIRQRYPHLTVAIVERAAQVGGRLQSLPVSGSQTAVELGGMRTFPDIDHYTAALLRMTGVTTVEVPYVLPQNVAYLRGKRTRMKALPGVAGRLYDLPVSERGKSASALLQHTLERELSAEGIVVAAMRAGVARPAPDSDHDGRVADVQCAQRTACADPALGRTTMWRALLDRGLSQQGFQYTVDSSGYDFTRSALAAAAGIRQEYSLSGLNSPQHWIVGGYRRVALALYDMLSSKGRSNGLGRHRAGDSDGSGNFRIAFNTDLVSMRFLDDDTRPCTSCRHAERHPTVECRLVGTPPHTFIQRDGPNVCAVDTTKGGDDNDKKASSDPVEWTLRAHHVILTAPRDDLVRIDAPWPERTKSIFGAVEPWRAVKVYLWFERAWWADPAIGLGAGGKNVTDLPARQVWFPFGDRLPVALIYCDQENSDFWVDLLPDAPDAIEPLRWHTPDRAPRLVAEALRQIGVVFGVDRTKMGRVERLVWRHWPYGTVFWRSERHPVGSIADMRKEILTPFGPHLPVIAVGDSFSWSQGWVDGAIETSDLALNTYWAIPTVLADGGGGGHKSVTRYHGGGGGDDASVSIDMQVRPRKRLGTRG